MPRLRHFGHWRELASFSQSTPRHFFLVGGSSAMVSAREGSGRSKGGAAEGGRLGFRADNVDESGAPSRSYLKQSIES